MRSGLLDSEDAAAGRPGVARPELDVDGEFRVVDVLACAGDHPVFQGLADLGDVGVLGQVDGEGQAATAAVEQVGRRAGDSAQSAEERLLLCVEELASSAPRHGRAPVQVDLTSFDHFWLLAVGDAVVETPPTPAVDRDAADGGLGLYLVARTCSAHGWTVEAARKVTWVRIDYTSHRGATEGGGRSAPSPTADHAPQPLSTARLTRAPGDAG